MEIKIKKYHNGKNTLKDILATKIKNNLMCGFGTVNQKIPNFKNLVQALFHRGPDEQGILRTKVHWALEDFQ